MTIWLCYKWYTQSLWNYAHPQWLINLFAPIFYLNTSSSLIIYLYIYIQVTKRRNFVLFWRINDENERCKFQRCRTAINKHFSTLSVYSPPDKRLLWYFQLQRIQRVIKLSLKMIGHNGVIQYHLLSWWRKLASVKSLKADVSSVRPSPIALTKG